MVRFEFFFLKKESWMFFFALFKFEMSMIDTDPCHLDFFIRNILFVNSIYFDYHYCTVIVEEYGASASIVWNDVLEVYTVFIRYKIPQKRKYYTDFHRDGFIFGKNEYFFITKTRNSK